MSFITGFVGGSYYNHYGAAANYLCLTKKPEYDNVAKPSYYAYLYGAEYFYISDHHGHDAVCSVCRAPQSTTIMVPGTLTCPTGWTTQYKGHLSAGYYGHYSASEYVCLDGSLEGRIGSSKALYGKLMTYTVSTCGSLPCPPYLGNRMVTCVVCSN